MWQLTRIELFKIFKKPRTYIAFVAIAAIILLVQLAFYIDGEKYMSFMMASVESSFTMEGNMMNGYFIFFVILQTLLVHAAINFFGCRRYGCRGSQYGDHEIIGHQTSIQDKYYSQQIFSNMYLYHCASKFYGIDWAFRFHADFWNK